MTSLPQVQSTGACADSIPEQYLPSRSIFDGHILTLIKATSTGFGKGVQELVGKAVLMYCLQ